MHFQEAKTFADGRFLVKRELGKGGVGVVYEAVDRERQMPVALKTLLHLDEDNLYFLKNEFRSLHDLVHPNLCSFMELIKDDSFWFITMELIQGKEFIDYVKSEIQGKAPATWSFDERRLRRALAGLSEGLSALHASGKIHRDVKPSNVLVTSEPRVVLLDFGLVTEAESRDQTLTDSFTGTAAYMAPEQADSQPLGPAADWYAVGAMLYQSLTGQLPFAGAPLKMIFEKQIYDPAEPSSLAPNVPRDLERLCLGLLKRNPDDRFGEDAIWETLDVHKEPTLVTARWDDISMTQQGTPFVGREEELDILSQEYWNVREGSFRAVVVEGVSGMGKSALIKKFTGKIESNSPSTLILKGRCYERESSPLKAFDGIDEAKLGHLSLLDTADQKKLIPRNPRYLVRMFPGLKKLDSFSDLPPLSSDIKDPQELQQSTFDTVREFFFMLCQQAPIVVIVDDVQWIDVDSLLLLHHLVGERNSPPFLLLLLSRSSLDSKSSGMDWQGIVQTEPAYIRLEPLNSRDAESLSRLLVALQNLAEQVDPRAIAMEAGGHPLFIAELVQHIASGAGDWQSLSLDDVIWHRVKTLPRLARHILEIACVAGTPLTREHLHTLSDLEGENFYKNIRLLDAINLVRSEGQRMHHLVEPYHDRVRESVFAHLASTGESTRIHLDIGRFFLRTYNESELEEDVFNVTHHLHAARELIRDEDEKMRLAEIYFLAGKVAQGAAAYASAVTYFKQSMACFTEERWKDRYDILFDLYSRAAEAAYITGDFALTTELVDRARAKARNVLDRAKILEIHVLSLVAEGKPLVAIEMAVRMIRRLKVRLPYKPSKLYVLLITMLSSLRLMGKTEEKLVGLPLVKNPNAVAARRLMRVVVDQVYMFLPNLWVSIINTSILLSLKYGIDQNAAIPFVGWGTINCAILGRYKYGYKYGKIALKMGERFGEAGRNPMVNFIFTVFVQHWRDHIRDTFPILLSGHKVAFKTGVISYEAYNGSYYCCHAFLSGMPLAQAIKNFAHYGSGIKDKKQDSPYNTNRVYYQTALNLAGPCPEPTRLEGIAYKASEMLPIKLREEQKLNLFEYHFCSTMLAVVFGRYADAHQMALEAQKYSTAVRGLFASAVFLFYDSISCLNCLAVVARGERRRLKRRVAANQKKYKKIAANSPANHLHKYHLVEAERAIVANRVAQAGELFDLAITGAGEYGFVQDAALAAELAADFYARQAQPDQVRAYAEKSIEFYKSWGAGAKLEHLRQKFGIETRQSRSPE